MSSLLPGSSSFQGLLVQRAIRIETVPQDASAVCVYASDTGKAVILSNSAFHRLEALTVGASINDLLSNHVWERETLAQLLDAGLLVNVEGGDLPAFSPFLPTFLGCPPGPPGVAHVSVFGAPFDLLSQTGAGQRGGPAALRVASIPLQYRLRPDTLRPVGWHDLGCNRQILDSVTFADAGDIPINPGETMDRVGLRLAKAVQLCIALGSMPLILGGDHSVSYWTISAFKRFFPKPISVVHFDAHSDLAERLDTGLPTNGGFARWLTEDFPDLPWLTVGMRGYLTAQQIPLSVGHKFITLEQVLTQGAAAVLRFLPPDQPCYVSFDIDVLDPAEAPGTNVPVPGGFSFREMQRILIAIGEQREVVGIDIVELNPERDPYSRTASVMVHLIMALLGASSYLNQERR